MENQGLEQHGRVAGGAANTPVGCLLVRGYQRSGMSTGDDAQKSSWSENGLKSLSPLSVVCSRSVAKFGEERQNDLRNPIFGYKILSLNFVQNDGGAFHSDSDAVQ